jgi:hypothetical protein
MVANNRRRFHMKNNGPSPSPIPKNPSHVYSAGEKLKLVFPCLRQKLHPRKNLLAGPYAGEFGYELMQWQGFVRTLRPRYQQVHVLTYPGRDYLYEGCTVHHHNIDLKDAGYWYGRLSPPEARSMAEARAAEIGLTDYDIFDTSLLCTRYHKILFWRQEFRLLEEPPLVKKIYDVLFHFRAVQKVGPDQVKNYSPTMADELVQRCQDLGLSVACYGHPAYAYCPEGCPDHRSVDLRETVAAISSAHLMAGEASGGMHLANACGKPTVIWGDGQWRISPALRWNPFRVPIYVVTITTWRPTPERVCESVVSAIADLRSRTADFQKPCYTLPGRPISNY